MILLDTDHLSILQQSQSPEYERLTAAMERPGDADFATTAISLEEQMRGWLAAIVALATSTINSTIIND